jgi:holin-like protein
MKYLKQLTIIWAIYFMGVFIQALFHLPIPGSVIGLLLLFVALYTRVIKIHMIEETCEFLLSHMSFLFIPAGVGLMTSFDLLKGKLIPILAIAFISTILVWMVTAVVVKYLRRAFA